MKGKPFGGADTGTSEMGSLDNINNDKNPHIHLREGQLANCRIKETWRNWAYTSVGEPSI